MAYSPSVISGSRFFRKSAESLMIRFKSALSAGRLASAPVGPSKSAAARQACHRGGGRFMASMVFKGAGVRHLHGNRLLHPATDLASLEDCGAELPSVDH